MEYLRWILLFAGIVFIFFLYYAGRKNSVRAGHFRAQGDDVTAEDSAVSSHYIDEIDDSDISGIHITASEIIEDDLDVNEPPVHHPEPMHHNSHDDVSQGGEKSDDHNQMLVLYILARSSNRLAGDKINSAALASGLHFGDMNIFHKYDGSERILFSMANMVEPGAFDPGSMFDLRTPGLTLFMQPLKKADNVSVFEDMLQCAYRISEMLDAELCNKQRQPLQQTDAENYRKTAESFNG